jgi:hypothetical protein
VKKFTFVLLIILSGCTSINKNVRHVTTPDSTAVLTVFREPGFMAGAVDALIGKDKQYFTKLSNREFARFEVDSGNHLFQVDVDGAPAFELALNLLPNTSVCIKVESNPKLAGVTLVPLVANFTPNFIMQKVACPNKNFFSDYQLVYGL